MNKKATEFLAGQEDVRLYRLTFCTNAMHAKQTREMTQRMPVIKRYLTPRGLMGMSIPLACRILAVADAF